LSLESYHNAQEMGMITYPAGAQRTHPPCGLSLSLSLFLSLLHFGVLTKCGQAMSPLRTKQITIMVK